MKMIQMTPNILLEQHMGEIERLGRHKLAVFVHGWNAPRPQVHHCQIGRIIGRPEYDRATERLANCLADIVRKKSTHFEFVRPALVERSAEWSCVIESKV